MDGWAEFRAPARIGVLVRELRAGVATLLGRKVDFIPISISGFVVQISFMALCSQPCRTADDYIVAVSLLLLPMAVPSTAGIDGLQCVLVCADRGSGSGPCAHADH